MQSINTTFRNSATIAHSKIGVLEIFVNGLAFLYVVASFTLITWPGLSRICLVLAFMLAAVVFIQTMAGGGRVPRVLYIPWVFLCFAAISTMWAKDEEVAYYGIAGAFSAIIGGTAIWQARNRGLFWKTIVWAAIAGSFVLVLSSRREMQTFAADVRLSGLAGNANVFAMSLCYTAFLIWCSPQKMPKWMHLLGVFLAFYGFYYSGSRKTLIVLAVGLLGLIGWALFRIKKASTWAILAGCLILSIFVAMYIQSHHIDVAEKLASIPTVDRMLRFFSGRQAAHDMRLEMMDEAIQLWETSPIVGLGPAQFQVYSTFGMYSHNNYTEILADFGLVGFFLYYSLHGILCSKALYHGFLKRSPPHRRAMILLIVIILLDMANVSYLGKINWILLGMTASLITAASTQKVRTMLPVAQFKYTRIPRQA